MVAKAGADEATKPQNNVSPTKRTFRSPRAASGGSSRRPMSSRLPAIKTTSVIFRTTIRCSVTSDVRAAGLLQLIWCRGSAQPLPVGMPGERQVLRQEMQPFDCIV